MFLIRVSGLFYCNQLGKNYEFPHYSTVLGAILCSWQKNKEIKEWKNTDMLDLAAKLGLKVGIFFRPDAKLRYLVEFTQYQDYNKGTVSPTSVHGFSGEYIILVSSHYSEVYSALENNPLYRIGQSTGGMPSLYEGCRINDLSEVFELFPDGLNMIKPNTNLVSFEYSPKKQEIMLVSQIPLEEARGIKLNIYAEFDLDYIDSANQPIEFLDYKILKSSQIENLKAFASKMFDKV